MKDRLHDKSFEKRKVPNLKVRTVWIVGWLITATALLILFWPQVKKTFTSKPPTEKSAATKKIENAGHDRLLGRWVRTDGEYVIEIRETFSDGKLNVAYFNPRPIHVSLAEWKLKNDKLMVIVELRDVNYPGSLYTLEFREEEKRMVGTYYQAVEGTTFDVAFALEN